ncbi:MAG TPA: hypothetical protein VM008_18020 [Phycisphaerae bacterium]|nr:hypothetical protein [Phycisphaerae bacterium]
MKLRTLSIASVLVCICTLLLQVSCSSGARSVHAPLATPASPRTPAEFRRAPDDTFLTYPEWFLVYSPREYADFISENPPSEFPFLRHIGQFWQGYGAVYDSTKDTRRFNYAYHSMIWVIGASMTGEYGATRAYESLIGRATEATRFGRMTPEDRLAADVAHEYASYLDKEPFYKFDYLTPCRRVWTDTPLLSANPLRSWERKYFLTTQYLFKAGYGWLIKQGSESAYGIESKYTVVVLDRDPSAAMTELKTLQQFPDGASLVQMPRYQAFTPAAMALAKSNARFLEIAGNSGPILITAIVPNNFSLPDSTLLFTQPIITHPGHKRIAFTVPVPHLSDALLRLNDPAIQLEHVYDF